eukprot:TRINITY_DN7766_c0_g2_i1.p1 TRINITY_DN7766_c0_g2~~TRINITY_DN7766_c0_g2_i1.p1  ORF type:complete len:118 (-),score=25.98 TRINITY_DN7766_c0_g2_i1:287-640(-)
MALLRSASRLAASMARQQPMLSRATAPKVVQPLVQPQGVRTFVSRSMPRRGHNLEDHFDFAEFMCKMHSPLGEYLIWGLIFSTFLVTFGPLLHSNYYFTGRFLPKDQGNTQLCDDSW